MSNRAIPHCLLPPYLVRDNFGLGSVIRLVRSVILRLSNKLYTPPRLFSFRIFGLVLFLPPAFEAGEDLLFVTLVAGGVVFPALE